MSVSAEPLVPNATQHNAMAEIALALAMAFFSILVLALVSMGAPGAAGPGLAEGVPVRPSAPAAAAKPVKAEALVVYHRGRFLDSSLKPVDPAAAGAARVLAVDPALPMTEAMAARARLPAPDVVVTTLDERWLTRLKEITP